MDRNYLAHRHGDANNAILAAAGYNFSLLIKWLRFLLRLVWALAALRAHCYWRVDRLSTLPPQLGTAPKLVAV